MSIAQGYCRSQNAMPETDIKIELATFEFEDIDVISNSDTECCAKSKALKNMHTACQFDLTATLCVSKIQSANATTTLALNNQHYHVGNFSIPDLKPPIS